MRILIINEFVIGGGAEQIAEDQVLLLKKNGHDVMQLCFNYSITEKTNKNWIDNRHIIANSHASFKIFFDIKLYVKIRKILKNFSPDKIILHNVFSSPMAVFYACKNHDTVQIIHDFKILCPTSLGILLNDNYKICHGFRTNSCLIHCSKGLKNFVIMLLRLIQLKEGFYFRKWFIKKFACPSEWLNSVVRKYGFQSTVLNNPINGFSAPNTRNEITPKLMTAGGLVFNKGVVAFANKLTEKNISLDIYGNRGTDEDLKGMEMVAFKSNRKIVYKGYITHGCLMEKMSEYSFLVVPSLWRENYPTIVLEGMVNKICIIASDRGGAKEMLSNGRGLLFSWDDEKSIDSIIDKICSMTKEEYCEIVAKAYQYVTDNNSFSRYYKKLCEMINL